MSKEKTSAPPWKHILNIGLASVGFVFVHMLLLPIRTKILTTILDKSDYGSLTLISTTLSLITLVSSLGSLEFLLRKLPGRDPSYQWSAFKTVAMWFGGGGAVLGVVGLFTFSVWHPDKLQFVSMGDLAVCAVLLVLTIHMTQVTHFLMGRSAYAQSRFAQILYADAWFLPVIAVYYLRGPVGITSVLWVWVGWTLLSWLCILRWVPATTFARTPASNQRLREVLAFGLPLAPMIAGDWLFRAGALYLMTDVEAVANYGLCFNIAWVGTIVGGAVLDILLTEFFKVRNRLAATTADSLAADPELRRMFSLMLRYGLVIVIPFGAVTGLASEPVIRFLSSPKFLDAAPLLPWLVPVPVLFLFIVVFGRTLMALHRNAAVGWITLVAAAANIVLCAILIPILGTKGAAIANDVTYAAVVVTFGAMVGVWKWIEVSALMPARLVALAALCAGGFLALRHTHAGTTATLVMGGTWCCACAFTLGLIRRSDFLGFSSSPNSETSDPTAPPVP